MTICRKLHLYANQLFFRLLALMAVPLLLTTCIDPFTAETARNAPILTVDGLISTDPGPHFVRLTRSDRYGSVFDGQISTVNNATVSVRDEEGVITPLTEVLQDSIRFYHSSDFPYVSPGPEFLFFPPYSWVAYPINRPTGVYQTPEHFQAEIGKTYTLLIQLANGDSFSSLPATITPVPPIESISIRTVTSPSSNALVASSGAQIVSHFSDPGDENNFYLWRVSDPIYPYITNPELAPSPLSCCERCFRYDDTAIANRFAIASDEAFNGLSGGQPTLTIPDDGWRFKDRLRANFHQYGITEDGYRFLRLVKQQLDIEGSVFDPPPANIRGNMISLDDPDRTVLGYFFACAAATRELYIRNEDLTFTQPPGLLPDDCRNAIGFSRQLTTQEPDDWQSN